MVSPKALRLSGLSALYVVGPDENSLSHLRPRADRTACGACERTEPDRQLPVLRKTVRAGRIQASNCAIQCSGDPGGFRLRASFRNCDFQPVSSVFFRSI